MPTRQLRRATAVTTLLVYPEERRERLKELIGIEDRA